VPRPSPATTRLACAAAILVLGCRGERSGPEQAARSDSALTARTWGLAYLQQNQLPNAEAQFRQVVALVPDQALGYADLGLVYLREGRYAEAEADLNRAMERDSSSNEVALMLAQVYQQTGREADAARELERVRRRDSTDVRAPYLLADLARRSADPQARARREALLRQVVTWAPANLVARLDLVDVLLERGAADSAAGELETLERQLPQLPPQAASFFEQSLRLARAGRAEEAAAPARRFHRAMEATAPYQVDLERLGGPRGEVAGYPVLAFSQSLIVPSEGARAVAQAIRFRDVTDEAGLSDLGSLPDSLTSPDRGYALAASDYDDDGAEDLLIAGHLMRGSLGRFLETGSQVGVSLRERSTAAAFGDYDNDGRMDLYLATAGGAALFHNEGNGTFRDVASAAGLRDGAGAVKAWFVDLDHDGDLDLFLASAAGVRVYRNNLDGTFSEISGPAGLAAGPSRDVGFGDLDGDARTDVVTAGADGRLHLFQNQGQGHFQDATAASGLAEKRGAVALAAGDLDNDGLLDLWVASRDGNRAVLYRNRGDGSFQADAQAGDVGRKLAEVEVSEVQLFDFDNDGWLDLLVLGRPASPAGRGVWLFRNDQGKRFEDFSSLLPDAPRAARAAVVADFDQDGDLDVVLVGTDGSPRLLRNDGGNANQYVDVRLVALRQGSGKNNGFGLGASIELRAGDLYQLRRVTDRVTHFGLGGRLKANVLRVWWTNGVSQTVYYPGSEQDVREQPVLKGSCPFLYAWDGSRFAFATDVMWNSALGMPLGIMGDAGHQETASPHASQEYLRIPSGLLQPRQGRYELRFNEELWETAYLDELKLVMVDHPDSVETYLNERFVPAGVSPLRLYQVTHPRPPVSARDDQGNDLLPQLRAQDDRYAATLRPTRYQGVTALHDLTLDFGDLAGIDSVFLFLNGWIYPTDASINFAMTQSQAIAIVPAQVQVRDARGQWRTVIPDIGFPAGKRKTVVVDLTGKFLSADHRVRIRTNMAIYWDRAFVAGTASESPLRVTRLEPARAELRYHGFGRMSLKGGRYGPQWFDYDDLQPDRRWVPIVGRYTRYGDVLPLLVAADDRYAIFGPGDEIALSFDSAAAPALPPGWTRDFVLYTEAWMKDADLNTASGATVEPLPFHGMKQYPYGPGEAYPSDPAHQRYRDSYNTRRVGRTRP